MLPDILDHRLPFLPCGFLKHCAKLKYYLFHVSIVPSHPWQAPHKYYKLIPPAVLAGLDQLPNSLYELTPPERTRNIILLGHIYVSENITIFMFLKMSNKLLIINDLLSPIWECCFNLNHLLKFSSKMFNI